MEHKEKNRRRFLLLDLALMLLMLAISVISFYIAYTFGIIPKKWITMAAAVVMLLWLILLLLCFKKLPAWLNAVRRIFLLLLCAVLGYSGFLLNKSRTTLNNISTTTLNSDGTVTVRNKLYIITDKEANISSLSELKGKVIGFQNGSDKENSEYLKEKISESLGMEYSEKEELDYTNLYADLTNGYIQAIAMSETFYNMSAANIEGFSNNTKIIETYEKETTDASKKQKDITKEAFTVYLSGLDNMGSPDQQTRTDTNLILIVNPRANHIDMVSLPRDGYMPNPALSNYNDKLTHTGNHGIETSVEAIENFYNIPIDYYARVSFNSLIEIVDTIGGIDVDVEISFCEQDENRSFAEDDLICLEKGEQELNGKEALAYARHRKTEGYDNPGRERAQQRIIKAIINKLMSPSALTSVNELMEIAPNYIITNMPSSSIASFVSSELEALKPWTISSISSDNGVYDSQYTASQGTQAKYDVYLFDPEEVRYVMNAYDGATHQLAMSEFSFDLKDLYKNTPALNDDPTIVWDYMASDQAH